MEQAMEILFGNWFFELPILEALSYVAAALMVGAAILSIPSRMIGTASQSSEAIDTEQPFGGEWESRKAA